LSSTLVQQWPSIVGALVALLLGSLFAGADTAVTSLSSARVGALAEQASGPERRAYERIQRDDVKLRSRYLVGRTAATAVLAVCLFDVLEGLLGTLTPYAVVAMTLIFGATLFEIVTTLARKHADRFAASAVRYLRPFELALLPIAAPLGFLGTRLNERSGEQAPDPKVTEAEVEALVEEGERSGLFGREPAEMIRNVLEFAERTARDVMIPRARVEAIDLSTPLDEVLRLVVESGHSRYPVYKEQIDNVAGLLYAKDLFDAMQWQPVPGGVPDKGAAKKTLNEIVRSPANFVAESQPLSSLLKEMKRRRQHLAIVVDEFGGVSGIVTLEDVLEEIVGDIRDEYDEAEEGTPQEPGLG